MAPRGPGSDSQNQQSNSQLSVTPVPGDSIPSYDVFGHQTCMWYKYTHAGKAYLK